MKNLKVGGTTLTIIFLLLFFFLPVVAQQESFYENWRWIQFTTESGLPSNFVYQIYEARDKTIWAATTRGIAWFDGFEWRPARFSEHNDVIPTGTILGEINDSILIFNGDGSLTLGKKTFRKLPIEKVDDAALLNNGVILARKNEQLWQIKNESMSLYSNQGKLFPDRVFLLYLVREGTVLLDAKPGLYRLKGNSLTVLFRSETERVYLNSVQENDEGNGIVSIYNPSSSRGIWLWDSAGNVRQEKNEGQDVVVAVAIGANDERIVVYKTGLVRQSISGKWKTVYDNAELRKTLCVCIGKNEDVWFATTNGVFVYRRSLSRWRYWKHPPPDFRNTVNEILKTRDGNFWIATTNGIDVRDKNGRVHSIESINGKRLYAVTGLAQDSSDNIWISSGSSFTGTYRWDGNKWTYFNPWADSEHVWIHKIYVDPQRKIWFLGLGKYYPRPGSKQPGVFMYEDGRLTHLGEEDGLLSGRVYSFAYSTDSSLWFGTYKGISRLKHGLWKHWLSSELNGGRAFTIAIDNHNQLWFGDNDFTFNGLGHIDADGGVRRYTTDDGLTSNNIWDIRVDPLGKIWISTLNGINCYNNGSWISYDEHSGLKSTGGNWPILPLEDKVYVGTAGEGVAILERNEEMTPPPRITVESPVVEGHSVLIRWKVLAYWGTPEPDDVKTRYRINNGSWSSWNSVHEKQLDNLASGEYVLQVQAAGLFGQFDSEGNTITFIISPPLYLRPIFYLPTSILLLSVIALGIVYRIKKHQAQVELQKSETRYRTITETAADAIITINENGIISFVNSAVEKIFGYSNDDLLGQNLSMLMPESYRQAHLDGRNRYLKTRQRHIEWNSVPLMGLHKSGNEIPIEISFAEFLIDGKSFFTGMIRDISERKRSEKALSESEERYRIITELVADYAYLDRIEEDGRLTILWITDSASRLTGYTIEEMKAPDFFQRYVHPDDLEASIMSMIKVMSGESVSHEVRVITKDGRVLWLQNESRPVWNDAHTRITYMYGAAHDITQRKLGEEQLRSLATELSHTEERERRRMALFLHDVIGQTIAICQMKLINLKNAISGDENKKSFQEIIQSIDETNKQTRSLTFELSPPILYDLGLEAAIQWLAEHMQEQHGIIFNFEDDSQLKSLSKDVRVLIFHSVREVMFNVVKHAQANNVSIKSQRVDSKIQIDISDDGIGFDISKADHRKNSRGFGIFSINERLRSIGGNVSVHSSPNKGTHVTITAPLETNISE